MAQGKLPDGRQQEELRRRLTDARVIALVDARRQHSLRQNYQLFERLKDYYETYRPVWQGRRRVFRNAINIPFTFAMIQSDVARKVQALFGAWPIVEFEGYAPEDASRARKNTVLVSAQMKDAMSVMKSADFFLQANICGNGVVRYGWRYQQRKNRMRRLETVAPGFQIPVVREFTDTIFNGPDWDPIDRLDFWDHPGRKTIPDMAWVIHRYYADWDDLMDDARSDRPYFDPAGVRMLQHFPMSQSQHGDMVRRRGYFRNQYDYEARQSERFAKPIEIWEMHGLVPREFAPDGIRHRCIAIGNAKVVLKNQEGPMPNFEKPFIAYSPMRDPYGFDGVGKAEIAYGPQVTADRLNNQKLDALDLLIDPQWVMNASVNVNTQNLFSRAGRIILVDGPANDQTIRPLSPDMRGFQAAYGEIANLFQFMQLGTGETESLLGLQGGSRETARGFLGRQENALTRLQLETLLASEGFVEPLANAFRTMNRMWLPTPKEVRILGSLASTNPFTGMPLEPESLEITDDDLAPDYRARAVGPAQMLGRSVRQQNFMALLQVMSANPALIQLVNWGAVARQAFDLFDMKNVEELLVKTVPAVNQIANETGQSPGAVAGAVSQPLEQLDPETLALLTNNQPAGLLAG